MYQMSNGVQNGDWFHVEDTITDQFDWLLVTSLNHIYFVVCNAFNLDNPKILSFGKEFSKLVGGCP